jgi:hypothetical protein
VIRTVLVLVFFFVLSVAAGILMATGDEYFDWAVGGGLFGLAVAGEGARIWIRRGRTKTEVKKDTTQSSGI